MNCKYWYEEDGEWCKATRYRVNCAGVKEQCTHPDKFEEKKEDGRTNKF